MNTWTIVFALVAALAATSLLVVARQCALLKRQVGELGKALEGANEQLDIFTSAMSDELQAPLRELHRIGRQPMHITRVDVEALVQEVVEELRPRYRRSTIRIGELHPVNGDRTLLRQAWTHLLDNALKFSASAQAPLVEIGSRTPDREIEYWVRDNGAGFDMAHRHRLFEVFQRVHTAEEFAGTGTGLAMVRLIVGRHGGTVRAQGRPGEGATFTVLLPKPP